MELPEWGMSLLDLVSVHLTFERAGYWIVDSSEPLFKTSSDTLMAKS